jgi:hypothetical protein
VRSSCPACHRGRSVFLPLLLHSRLPSSAKGQVQWRGRQHWRNRSSNETCDRLATPPRSDDVSTNDDEQPRPTAGLVLPGYPPTPTSVPPSSPNESSGESRQLGQSRQPNQSRHHTIFGPRWPPQRARGREYLSPADPSCRRCRSAGAPGEVSRPRHPNSARDCAPELSFDSRQHNQSSRFCLSLKASNTCPRRSMETMEKQLHCHTMDWTPNDLVQSVVQVDEQGVAEVEEALEYFKSSSPRC